MNNGDKTLCRANLFVGEEEPILFQIQSSEPLAHLICQHESIIIRLTRTSFVLWSRPRIELAQYLTVMYTYTAMMFGWKYTLKMVSSMHNEADAEDYIVWHRIWICIDYLLFDLAAVWV